LLPASPIPCPLLQVFTARTIVWVVYSGLSPVAAPFFFFFFSFFLIALPKPTVKRRVNLDVDRPELLPFSWGRSVSRRVLGCTPCNGSYAPPDSDFCFYFRLALPISPESIGLFVSRAGNRFSARDPSHVLGCWFSIDEAKMGTNWAAPIAPVPGLPVSA